MKEDSSIIVNMNILHRSIRIYILYSILKYKRRGFTYFGMAEQCYYSYYNGFYDLESSSLLYNSKQNDSL